MTGHRLAGPAPSSHRIPVNGLTYRYLRWGERHAPTLLMLHGLRSYAHTWAPVAAALAGSYQVVAPDFRGRGDSSWGPPDQYFAGVYVRDIEQLVAGLGLSRFGIVGHSLGGAVGYLYAARHPQQVDALVVEDIGPDSSTGSAGADRILREVADIPDSFDDLDAVRSYWRGLRPGITDAALASRVEHTVREGPDGRWCWKLDMQGIAAARRRADPAGPPDLWACVDALACPTLVVRGADSDFLPADTCRRMAERQPLLRWAEVAGAGHYVHDDDPKAFIGLVADFLAVGPP